MKIYVHVEVSESCTLIVHSNSRTTVDELKQEALGRYESKYGTKISPTEVQFCTRFQKALDGDKKVEMYFENLDDAFISAKNTLANASSSRKTSRKVTGELSAEALAQLIAKGKQETTEKHYRAAHECYKEILVSSPTHKEALILAMELWICVGRPHQAKDLCDRVLRHYPADLAAIVAAGKLKHACKEHEASTQLFNRALEVMRKKDHVSHSLKDVEIMAANSMYCLGGAWQGPAVQLVMSVVEPERSHFEGLLLYAKIAYDRGLLQDAARVLLRLVVQQQERKEVKELLANCLQKEESIGYLLEDMKSNEGLASACAFLAARVKDYGAIQGALKLYKKALEREPENPSIALNYLHTLELILEVEKAFEFMLTFLKQCRIPLIKHLENKEITRLMDGLPSFGERGKTGWYNVEIWQPHHHKDEVEEIIKKVKFSDSQLDLLASIFTSIKMLFVGGALERAYQAVELILPCCKATQVELHKTLIRNEAAYFNCIRQIVLDYPPPPVTAPHVPLDIIYLCGDSHCLPGSWRRFDLHGKEHVLVPKLVTGCKVWHLRDESRFYPKTGFLKTIESIPDNSKVIFLFGEIDCREGIRLAVEKCKYDTQKEAIGKTILVYLEVLEDLIADRNFQVYVHPVPPVLDITRPVVKAYNGALKKAILETIEEKEYLAGKLFWLDFFQDLLSEDGQKLNPKLSFDDTHLSPIYTQYLESALLKCE